MPSSAATPPHWLHPPDLAAARVAQQEMAAHVVAEDALPATVTRLGGADISTHRFDPDARVFATLVTLDAETLAPLARAGRVARAPFPYVPGFLGFREVPALVEAWETLDPKPDLVMVDGHGIAHPRGLGVACHLGLVLDVPTIGVAKSVLVGQLAAPLGEEPGAVAPLVWQGREIGRAVRTRKRSNPLYVSVGHRVSLATAVARVLRAGAGRRLPETTRQAHLAANELRRASLAEAAGG